MDHFDPTIELYNQTVTELIPMIENANIASPLIREATNKCLLPLISKNIDTLILGCTHLPFIRHIIQDICGPTVSIIDPAKRTAVLCTKRLADLKLTREGGERRGKCKFFTSGSVKHFERTASILLEKEITGVKRMQFD